MSLTKNLHRMKLQSSHVGLHGVRLHAFHGVLPQERAVGNDYLIDLRLSCDVSRAMQTDDVADTVNYADVYQIVCREMSVPSQLLEHVAGRIARAVMAELPMVTGVELRLTKENPPMGADCQGASIEIQMIK